MAKRNDTATLVEEMKRARRAKLYLFAGLLLLVVVGIAAFIFLSSGEKIEKPATKTENKTASAKSDKAVKDSNTDAAPKKPEKAVEQLKVVIQLQMKRGMRVKLDGELLRAKRRKAKVELLPGEYLLETKLRRRRWLKQKLVVPKQEKPVQLRFNKRKRKWLVR